MDFISIFINIMGILCVLCVFAVILCGLVNSIIQILSILYEFIEDFIDDIKSRKTSDCTICLNTVSNKPLKCGHIFHNKCIKTWLRQHDTCPNCRCEV